jgi:ribonuclease HI
MSNHCPLFAFAEAAEPESMPANPGAHFLLFTEARFDGERGGWRFVLSEVGSPDSFAAADVEPITCRERLELFAVVRGLEALEQPARVTLVTNSRYVNRGLKNGLADWRACHWQWERFGQLVPVRNGDLWQRVDRALQFHELDCRLWHFDAGVEVHGDADVADAAAPAVDPDQAAYPVKNHRRRAERTFRWDDALEPAGLAG